MISTGANQSNGFSIALLLNNDFTNNGFSFGSFANAGDGSRNGLAVAGLFLSAKNIRGIGVAGLWIIADTLKGIFLSVGITGSGTRDIKMIKGFSIGIAGVGAEEISGFSIGGIGVGANKYKGILIGGMNKIEEMNGIQIGIFNKAKKLKGIQLGLINYVSNNPRLLRVLPIFNLNLKSKK